MRTVICRRGAFGDYYGGDSDDVGVHLARDAYPEWSDIKDTAAGLLQAGGALAEGGTGDNDDDDFISAFALNFPAHNGGLDLKRGLKSHHARSVERGGAGEKPADWVAGAPSGGKGTWRVARLLQAALGGARGGWEERHIGGAESARGALGCGQRREHRHFVMSLSK